MVTQQFHETLEPLSEWLAATEKHLINSEPIGTETSKLEDQISQHKVKIRILILIFVFILRFNTISFDVLILVPFVLLIIFKLPHYLPFSI